MALSHDAPGVTEARVAQLRHDLLNPLNVLTGATAALLETELTDAQRAWVHMLRSTTNRLLEIVEQIDDMGSGHGPPSAALVDGRARLADLLSIAAARVGKPFNRQQLVGAIRGVAGDRPLRILLVDDSPELVQLVESFLKGTGWNVDVVENGERAVAQATGESYDLVLMDIDLPGVDGATAAHAIRAADLARGASPTPIIAMTAFDFASTESRQQPGTVAASSVTQAASPTADDGGTYVVVIEDPEIASLVPEFLDNRRADVGVFREALTASAFERIQSHAHKMKGSGRGYGFSVISRIGNDLELAAEQYDVSKIAALIDELEDYVSKVRASGRS